MFPCRAASTVCRLGLCLALGQALVAGRAGAAEPAPLLLRCVTAGAAGSGTEAQAKGSCAAGNEGQARSGKPAHPSGPAAGASSISTSVSTVNVAVGCGAACAGPERAASAAPAAAASWPAWAIAHLAEEDALRRQDSLFRGGLLVVALLFALGLAAPACRLALRSAEQARQDDGMRFTSHWGGFGGSAGGWQVGPACVSLLGAGLLAAAAAAIVGAVLDSARPQAPAAVAVPTLPTFEKK